MTTRCSLRMLVTKSISLRCWPMPSSSTWPPGRHRSKAICRAGPLPLASMTMSKPAAAKLLCVGDSFGVASIHGMAGAKLAQAAQPLVIHVDHEHLACADSLRGQQRECAHGAAANNGKAKKGCGRKQPEKMHHIRQRLGENGAFPIERVGHLIDLGSGKSDELCKCACRLVHAQQTPAGAQVLRACKASVTAAATDQRIRNYAAAVRHAAHKFVAEDERRFAARTVAEEA